jgi:N-acetylglucosamine kinase-like BadF-type ATPase
MKLIADSGSTKTDWCLIDGDEIVYFKTKGLNPFFYSAAEFCAVLKSDLKPKLPKATVHEINFYGSGCTPGEKTTMVENCLREVFATKKIKVESDLLGAAKGLAQHKKGLVLILGTGSNTGFYDGKLITEQVASLGYLLGDEGSGSKIGKQLIADYYRKKMPEILADKFSAEFSLAASSELIENIFKENHPGKFLASFAKFAIDYRFEFYISSLIQKHFNKLFEEIIMSYNQTNDCIYATGSISYYFEDELKEVAKKYNLKIALIKQSPIEGLAKYHFN